MNSEASLSSTSATATTAGAAAPTASSDGNNNQTQHVMTPNEIVQDLNKQLAAERAKTRSLTEEIKQLKHAQLRLQLVTENEEEYITNKFMKYLTQLKKEKEHLALKVEQEEEYLTNTLQKKMHAIMKEKVDLEKVLEVEEEFIVNKLQKQIEEVNREKRALEKRLESELSDHKHLLKLEGEVLVLQQKIKELEGSSEHNKEDIAALKSENFVLCQKIAREQEKINRVTSENTSLMFKLEIGDESNFNSLKRNRSVSAPNVPKEVILPTTPSPKVGGVPLSRARSSSSNVNSYLMAQVLKEGWIKVRVDNHPERRFCQLASSGELREFQDENKQVLLSTTNMDNVVDIIENVSNGTLELVIQSSGERETRSHYTIEKHDFQQWKGLLLQLMPKPSLQSEEK